MTNYKGTVGILAVSIGRYDIFWPGLYESCEQYFLPEYKKNYYLFTDKLDIKYHGMQNVHIYEQHRLGWPYEVLLRYEMFLTIKEELLKNDYLFFLNLNLICKSEVGEEILPTKENDFITVGSHPGFYNKKPEEFAYERNPRSMCYIPIGEGKHYAPGGINGGTSKAFMELYEKCNFFIQVDMANQIIPVWHDESALNKYILDKNPKILPLNYMYPTGVTWLKDNIYSKDIKLELRDKSDPKWGGHAYLRGLSDEKLT